MRIRALVVAIFLVGVGLRAHRLGAFPEPNRTADEYAWTWAGMTLVAEGTPRAWSWLPAYGAALVHTWRGNEYKIVRPWFDHPPLYPMYVGAFMHAAGTHDIWQVELATARRSTLVLFAASFFLGFLVMRRSADETHAIVALAFFAVAPAAVWNGRLVMAEQLLLPLALAGWYALQRAGEADATRANTRDGDARARSSRRGWLVAVGVAAALLPLCKVAGLGFALFLFSAAVLRRDRTLAAVVCLGAALGLAAWAAYGWHYGWTLFRAVLDNQSSRFSNFGGFFALVFNQRVVSQAFNYLPFLLGFMTLVADLREGRHVEMALFAVVYAVGIAFFLPWNEYGWYLIPLYPAMAFGLASFVVRAWRESSAGALWAWLLFSGTYLAWIAADCELVEPHKLRYVYIAVAVLLPFTALLTRRAPRVWRAILVGLVALQLLGDALYAFRK